MKKVTRRTKPKATKTRLPKQPKATKMPKTPKAPKVPKKVVDTLLKAASGITGAASKAIKNFAANLGSMKIDKLQAADQMEELGELLEDVAKALGTSITKADEAKTAKGTYDSKVNLLLEKLRGFTHPKALPLFDQHQAEADLVDMTTRDQTAGDTTTDVARQL
jgi:hypothetical protein